MPPTSSAIREQFLDFFVKKHGHTFVPSSPVVPFDDHTLLFANAGMNQFKDVFLGTGHRPFRRAANSQKCIRAGGKHNDLDDVGKDTYHHTFFEMLGNWSFGDYFKKEAIAWAWELLTDVWQLDPARLHVTVFEGDPDDGVPRDDEAVHYWREVAGVPAKQIHTGSKKDNFWEMGSTGPCGPCTEIHIDRTPDKRGGKLVNAGTPEVIEIWNLVFIQYNRGEDGTLTPLPAKHVDTGMGFERIAAVLQGVDSNYNTDLFTPLFDAIQERTKAEPYTGGLQNPKDIAYRVIADHLRMLTFALTDGATPSNAGAGYVVRSVLRRAERYGRQYLGTDEPFLHDLVPTVVDLMGDAFPELKHNPQKVLDIVLDEEKSFLRTYARGFKLFQEVVDRVKHEGKSVILGEDVFDLHQTHGFFADITEQMAAEVGLGVDRSRFDELMDEHEHISRHGGGKAVVSAISGTLPDTDDTPKYQRQPCAARVLGWVEHNQVHSQGGVPADEEVMLLLDRTCFYAEQGGQVGDAGSITAKGSTFTVRDTQRLGDSVLHIGQVTEGNLQVGDSVEAVVTDNRFDTMRNHTATHLLNHALRQVLGDHVEQRGSLVNAEKTRFDFTHPQPLTAEEVRRIEAIVNAQIQADLPVSAVPMPLDKAKNLPGVRAVFGEKYPDPVRVILIGADTPEEAQPDQSIEFCGGTHLDRTSQASLFKIVGQELVSKGVRRVTAVTGPAAFQEVQAMTGVVEDLTGKLHCRPEELPNRVLTLQDEVKKLQQQLKKGAASDLTASADKLFDTAEQVGSTKLLIGEIPAGPVEQIRSQMDRLRQKAESSFITLFWHDAGKVSLLVALSQDLVDRGLSASELIKPIAEAVGGKGGGKRADLAQAGGKEPDKIPAAIEQAKRLAQQQLA